MKSKGTPQKESEPFVQAFIEKRNTLRNPLFVLEVKWKQYDKVFLGRTENLSLGGLFMETGETLQVGERFPLEFILPDKKTRVGCTGEVIWTRIYSREGIGSEGAGVRFIDLDSKKLKAITQWIQSQETRSRKKS